MFLRQIIETRIVAEQDNYSSLAMLSFALPLAAFVLGCALQLQERALLSGWIYGSFCLLAGVLIAYIAITNIAFKRRGEASIKPVNRVAGLLILCGAAALVGFGQAGWRGVAFSKQAIDSALEGRDIRITGVVAAMPQRDESGLRFRLDVESAQLIDEG